MNSRARLLAPSVLLLPALACNGGDGGKDDSGFVGTPPDMASHYNVILGGTSGCEGEESWIADWAEGPLNVSGSSGELTFDFGDGMSFLGSVSAAWQWGFSGDVIWNEATLEVYGSGSVSNETSDAGGAQLVIEGSIEAEVDDDEFETNNCTIEGVFEAYELTGV